MKFKLVSTNDRKLNINLDKINLYVSRYKPNTKFDFEITRRVSRRSDPMRKYYFSTVVRIFMDHLGYEPHELEIFHRQLKITFFQIKPDNKGIYRNVPSVFSNESNIAVPDKKRFVDWVIRTAAKEGVYIPDPGEKE